MATEIELNAKINTAGTAQGLSELKKSLKDLVSLQSQVGAGTEGFKKLQAAINDTEGKIGDLKDGLKTLSGSGVERLTSSLGLLREGFAGADPEKVGVAFKGLGAAMSAIPIFLLLEGVKLLAENFKEIIKFFGFGVLESERLTAALEQQKKVNEGLFATQENSIAIMKAEGASMKDILDATNKLNEAKIKAAKNDIELQKLKIREVLLNDSVKESLDRTGAAILRAQGNSKAADMIESQIQKDKLKRASEFGEQIRTDLIAINKLETDNKIAVIESEKKQTKDLKAELDERTKNRLEYEKQIAENRITGAQIDKDNKALIKKDLDLEKSLEEQTRIENEQKEYEALLERIRLKKKTAEDELLIEKALAEQKVQVQKQAFGVASQITGLASQLAGQNKAVQKAVLIADNAIGIAKMITANKVANIAALATPQAVASGGLSAIPVIAFNNISTGLGIAASVAATAKALGLLGGGGSATAPSIGGSIGAPSSSGSIAPPPTAQPQQQNTTTFTGNNNNNFNQPPIKVYVPETDIRNATDRIDRIKEQATF